MAKTINVTVLSGKVFKVPDIKEYNGGQIVTAYLETEKAQGKTQVIPVKGFGDQGKALTKLKLGQSVTVTGVLSANEGKDGRYFLDAIANSVEPGMLTVSTATVQIPAHDDPSVPF